MASISRDASGKIRVMFTDAAKKRRAVYLGNVNKKHAETIKMRVETLAASVTSKTPLDGETAAWVGSIGDDLAEKLAAVGLIAERPKAITMAGLLKLYLDEKEVDNKGGTKTNHRTISNDLIGYFGENADPRAITSERAKQFLDHLRERKLAAGTVSRRMRRVRSIFAYAVKRKAITSNPFTEVKAMSVLPSERRAFLSAADTKKLLNVATPIWRTIIALARFAGMRCPSEVLLLKWSDVNFETGRMTVPSCKTEHIPGKEYRVTPIFAELRPHLEEAFELAAEGEVYVVGTKQGDDYRAASQGADGWKNCNLRTQMLRLIKRAGLKPWPRLFNTMRASCETDLMERFPISAVVEWLGHSATVALKHYTRIPDELFERAAKSDALRSGASSASAGIAGDVVRNTDAESDARATQNTTQTGADGKRPERTDLDGLLVKQAFRPNLSAPGFSSPNASMTLPGFEPGFEP